MRKLFYVCVLAAGGLGGCTKPNPALSCEDGLCSDPTVPYCDVTGSISGEPNTCVHVSCTPNEFTECRGDKALTCNAAGDNYDLLSCANGCSAEDNGCKAPPPCETLECQKHIIPKYLPTECDTLATNGDLTISANTTLDTSMDAMCTKIVPQSQGPELCVVHYANITIQQNFTYKVAGSRALALVADTTAVVDGIVDGSATNGTPGPGGGTVMSGSTSGYTVPGGGAGGRTLGGAGASAQADGGAANGGAAATNPTLATYLLGGARTAEAPNGGGALTIIACRGQLTVSGLIDVGGGGGNRGRQDGITYAYAAGGGAAGTVVLQGKSVTVTGQLYANGGGGGGGGAIDSTGGAKGTRSTTPAAGGTGDGGADGGHGGTNSAPGPGKTTGGTKGGAGGGAAGFLLTYTPSGVAPTMTPLAVSPMFEANQTIPTN